MTKAQEEANRVAANKRRAYADKVRRLLGHLVSKRLDAAELTTAYNGGMTADAYAALVASREPVGAAIHPMKVDAVAWATRNANKTIEWVKAELEKAGWDLQVAAPYPRSFGNGREAYAVAKGRYGLFHRLTKAAEGSRSRNMGDDPDPCVMDPDGAARFIANREEEAATLYDAFICKLVSKVGDVKSASIEGSHVWGQSILTVTTKAGEVQLWKTQQIVNTSSLGLRFPQWPTRQIKSPVKAPQAKMAAPKMATAEATSSSYHAAPNGASWGIIGPDGQWVRGAPSSRPGYPTPLRLFRSQEAAQAAANAL